MAHYAKVLDGIVVDVIVADQEYIDNMVDTSPGKWIQTSYNSRGGIHYTDGNPDDLPALRMNYATVGYSYDERLDAFIPPQPYPSWTLDEECCLWRPPVAPPMTEYPCSWDENKQQWILSEKEQA